MDTTGPKHMPHKLLEEITGGFSAERILGSGGFGVVYRGEDKNGQEIAVKRLHYSLNLDDKVFRREFNNLSKLNHPNIVQLVGFCCEAELVPIEHEGKHIIAERRHRALCFEYMQNGSLQELISDARKGLGWQDRYKIIKGICEGLKYLHMGLENPICHLDLKPANILLDKKMVPKIADFGISRLVGEENTRRTNNPAGTPGFMPPEFIRFNLTSKEYDIYSLGVIIIMIVVGPRGYSLISDMKPAEFVAHVHNEWRERLQAIQGYTWFEVECQQVKKCIEIALKCMDEKAKRRPTIGFVVDLLSETEKHKNGPTSCTEEQRNDSYHKLSPLGLSSSSLQYGSLKRSPNIDPDASRGKSPERKLNHLRSTIPREIPASFLKGITDDLSHERILSYSVFGTFYKGILPEGREIVVKKLAENWPGAQGKEFDAEITKLNGIQHENIVKLVGFCHEAKKEVVKHNGRYVIVDLVESFLCYEYLPMAMGTLEKYISGETRTIDWDTRFKIIMGICTGLRFLHMEFDGPLIHMNITPGSIWLDDNWVPKIGEFGLSRLFGQDKTRMNTINVIGQNGYMAPEYLFRGEISTKSDIYSLGILILEITSGVKNMPSSEDRAGRKFVDEVYQWKTDDQITSKYPSLDACGLGQVKTCIEIGFRCAEIDRRKRPSIEEIVNKLKMMRVTTELLDVYPVPLRFPFNPNKSISCSLQLTNRADDCVAVRLLPKRYKMPLCGIVPPLSTYTLVVTTREQKKKPPSNDDEFLTLESSIVREGDLSLKNTDVNSVAVEYGIFFKKAKETNADKVHELTLKIVCDPPGGATSGQPLQPEVQIISKNNFAHVLSVDVHPMKPWIMTSHHRGNIVIWDYNTQEMVRSFNITEEPVYSSKFIEREQWLVAGDGEGTIYVYNYYVTEQPVRTVEEAHDSRITSLAVHPTDPFVISSSDDHKIKLWDWEKDWKYIRIFEEHDNMVKQVNFNPIDTSSFVSASLDHTIKIWSISSSESKMTLRDHPDGMLCAHNYTSDTGEFFITGSWDGTAQIWDLKTERCIQTLKGHVNSIGTVYHHPELPILITGSHDGTVRLWDSYSYRVENVIGFNLGVVYAFGYIKSLRRIVVGCHQGIAIMEINLSQDRWTEGIDDLLGDNDEMVVQEIDEMVMQELPEPMPWDAEER